MSPSPQSIQRGLDYASLRYEKNRLDTFDSWPQDAPISKERLAKAGFFFKSSPLRVECFSCGGTVDEWRGCEQVMLKHRRLFPSCAFVNERSENVPLVQLSTPLAPPQRTEDSGYGSTSSSHSPLSSQESTGSTSPRSGFRYPVVAARLSQDSTTSSTSSDEHQRNNQQDHQQQQPPPPLTSWRDYAFLSRERMRLRTFADWSCEAVAAGDLARAGFVSMNDADKTQCVFCRGVVGNWESGDVPMEEHQRHFPVCPFVRGCRVGNVPLEGDSEESDEDDEELLRLGDGALIGGDGLRAPIGDVVATTTPSSVIPPNLMAYGQDEVGWRLDYRTNSEPENARAGYPLSQLNVRTADGCALTDSQLSELGIAEYRAPINPSYATVESRLRSYQYWPPALSQKPRQLADAGFFYVGVSDHVKCFHCDGGLRNWVPGDDPWVEHARWFATCGFLRLIKGPDYVRGVLRDHPRDPPPPAASDDGLPAADDAEQRHRQLQLLRQQQRDGRFSEQQVEAMMKNAICETAIQLGLPRETVKRALRLQLAATGVPFSDVSGVLSMAVGLEEGGRSQTATNTSTGGVADETGTSPSSGCSTAGSGCHGRADSQLSAASSSGADSGVEDARSHVDTTAAAAMDTNQQSESGCPSAAVATSGCGPSDTLLSQLSLNSDASTVVPSGAGTPKLLSTESASSDQMEEEFRRLKDQKQCKVCMDADVGVVFLPCGHLITCVNCAPALRDCPLCRQPIRGTVRTYLS